MNIEVNEFCTKTIRAKKFELDGVLAVVVSQRSTVNKETLAIVWFVPKMTIKEIEVFDDEHFSRLKSVIDMGNNTLQSWMNDVGKEIAKG